MAPDDNVATVKKLIISRFDLTSDEAGRLLELLAVYKKTPVEALAAKIVAEARKQGEV